MTSTSSHPLPRGRHNLSREEVALAQRDRMLDALAQAMAEKGYVATSVSDVIKRAGVSRETFYQQFESKHHCFMAAFEVAGDLLAARLFEVIEGTGTGTERFAAAIDAYLDGLATYPAYARLYLVEVYAAGDEAMRKRKERQDVIADGLADIFALVDDDDRFACEVLVAGISSLVTPPLVEEDLDALRRLGPSLVRTAARLFA